MGNHAPLLRVRRVQGLMLPLPRLINERRGPLG